MIDHGPPFNPTDVGIFFGLITCCHVVYLAAHPLLKNTMGKVFNDQKELEKHIWCMRVLSSAHAIAGKLCIK